MTDRKPTPTDLLGNRAMLAHSACETAAQLREHADNIDPRSPELAATLREVADEVIAEGTEKIDKYAYYASSSARRGTTCTCGRPADPHPYVEGLCR